METVDVVVIILFNMKTIFNITTLGKSLFISLLWFLEMKKMTIFSFWWMIDSSSFIIPYHSLRVFLCPRKHLSISKSKYPSNSASASLSKCPIAPLPKSLVISTSTSPSNKEAQHFVSKQHTVSSSKSPSAPPRKSTNVTPSSSPTLTIKSQNYRLSARASLPARL